MHDVKAQRGSEILLAAWKNRQVHLNEEFMRELGEILAQSPGKVESASFDGGAAPVGASFSLSYDGDDIPRCGNDFRKIHHLAGKHGIQGPIIIINGIPAWDRMNVEVQLGAGF